MADRPILHSGFRVPFDALEPEPFASFIHGALHEIGALRGWRDLQQTDVGKDGGFDSSAKNEAGETVCIQCKRHQSISTPEVGLELAKVALNSALDDLTIGEHVIVCSGKVRDVLRKALDDTKRAKLLEQALEQASENSLKNLRRRASEAGIDVELTVRNYVNRIRLTVWSGHEFDGQLALVWRRLQDLFDRTFVVHTVVREHPRPDFDEQRYLELCQAAAPRRWVDPRCKIGPLPGLVRRASAADPFAESSGPRQEPLADGPQAVESVVTEATVGIHLLIGDGGAGKSTALQRARSTLLSERRCEHPEAALPVLVELGVVQGTLDAAIQAALGVQHGHWSAIPGSLLLLLDGLEDVPIARLPAIAKEISELGRRIAIVVTSRDAGPKALVVLPAIRAWHFLLLGNAEVVELASSLLDRPQIAAFLDAWLRLGGDDIFFRRPQAVSAALRVWQERGSLPENHRGLLEAVLDVARQREDERFGSLPAELVGVPPETTFTLARRLVERTWLRDGVRHRTRSEFRTLLNGSLAQIKTEGVYGADALNTTDAELLMIHFGFAIPDEKAGIVQLPHETICSYLASDYLAATWREELGKRSALVYDRAWLSGASAIPEADRTAFLNAAGDIDLFWMARLAVEMGCESLVESRVLKEADERITSYSIAIAAEALAVLRTPSALARLRFWARQVPGWHRNHSRRALAQVGDHDLISEIRPLVETNTGNPVTISGGDVDLWPLTPLAVRLQIARDAVNSSQSGRLAQSFQLLREWGDESDAERIDEALTRSQHELASWQYGVQALHRFDPIRARRHLEQVLADRDHPDRVYILELSVGLGEEGDADYLVELVVTPTNEAVPENMLGMGPKEHRQHRATELLRQMPLNAAQIARLELALDDGDFNVRACALAVLLPKALPAIVARAQRTLENPDGSSMTLDQALWVLSDHSPTRELAEMAFKAFSSGLASDSGTHQVYKMCRAAGLENEANIVKKQVAALIRDAMSDSSEATFRFTARMWLSIWGASFGEDVECLAHPSEVLSWDLDGIGGKGVPALFRAALAAMRPPERIETIHGISRPEWRTKVIRWALDDLSMVHALVPEIIRAMRDCFLPTDALIEAAEIAWNDDLASATIENLKSIFGAQIDFDPRFRADKLVNRLGFLFTEQQAERYVGGSVASAADQKLKDVLQFIYELAHRRR